MSQPFSPFPGERSSWGRGGDSRSHNLGLALRCVAERAGTISRAGIAASTGLHRSTASSLVDELISGGLVRELGVGTRQGVGRPPTTLALTTRGPAGLGLEIDGSRMTACVVDLTGAVRHRRVLEEGGRPATADALARSVLHLAEDAARTVAHSGLVVCGTAVALTGLRDGVVAGAASSQGPTTSAGCLVEALQARGSHPGLAVDDEVSFAAQSEDTFLHGEESYLYVTGGDDVAAALVLDGRPYRGRQGWRCELGHRTVQADGPACPCGGRGCLEQYAGPEAILRSLGLATGGEGGRTDLQTVVSLALERLRDTDARGPAALHAAGSALGQVLGGLVTSVEVDRVVLGGIYRDLAPWIASDVAGELSACFAAGRWQAPVVEVASHGTDAPAVGAARSRIREVLRDPTAWLAR